MNETPETTILETPQMTKFQQITTNPKVRKAASVTLDVGKQVLIASTVTIGASLLSSAVLKKLNPQEGTVLRLVPESDELPTLELELDEVL